MGCATTTVKISSIAFNIILALFSIGAIIWISFNPDSLSEEIAIGAYITCSLIVFFAFLGCFATIRESVCLMATCAVFLLALAVLQITLTCIGISENGVRSGFDTVNISWNKNAMDEIQTEHDCCGKTSANDYILIKKPVPASCYIHQDPSNTLNLHTEGCTEKLTKYYEEESYRFAIVSWSLIAFELVGFLLAVFLVINFRNTQRRMQF